MMSDAPLSLAPSGGAEADRALREDGHGVADLDVAALRARQPGREDVRTEHDVFVGQARRDRCEVGSGVRHQQVLGPRAVDGVAEAPAADAAAALRVHTVQAVEALAAWRDGADDDALPDGVELFEARLRAPR